MKNYLIAIIAIIGFVALIQGASAQTGEITYNCSPIQSMSIDLTVNDQGTAPGVQIDPAQAPCLKVKQCAVTPATQCTCSSCGCTLNANGQPAMNGTGTHCMGTGGYYKCPYVPTSCNYTPYNNGCDYNSTGGWVGDNNGGYEYDEDDGYKMGLKEVNVSITINAPSGIGSVCRGGSCGNGVVKMIVDNYDVQNGLSTRHAIVLNDPALCGSNPAAISAVWTGKLYMHYWEKPGMYTVQADATSCCGSTVRATTTFDYRELTSLCVAPPGKTIGYGTVTCDPSNPNKNATVNGDVETSTCAQCDIGSAAATIRNIGNSVTTVNISASDLSCVTPDTCNTKKIPVSKLVNGIEMPGDMWIDLGNGWKKVWNTPQLTLLTHQSYCNKTTQGCCNSTTEDVYGLPPGPHATNIMNLMVMPIPCLDPGTYRQTITVSPMSITGCCQDHREPVWPDTIPGDAYNNCVTPPQAYEVPGRYLWGTPTQD